MLPRSSTIQRFIESDKYYNGFDKVEMDLDWLVDTEINLGKGRQAIVRLMLLGGHQYVAVKVIYLDKKNRFNEEAEIWRQLHKTSGNLKRSIPKLFAITTMTAQDGKRFGVIITELGVPVNDIFENLNEVKRGLVKEEHFCTFFKCFRKVSFYTGKIF